MQQSLLAGGAVLTSAISAAAGTATNKDLLDYKPFNLNYGIHDGTFKNLAGNDFIE